YKIKKTYFMLFFCCFCVGILWYIGGNEKKIHGVVTNISADEFVFEDEKQNEYSIQKRSSLSNDVGKEKS
ncbi:TPA: hypothetical protein ACHAR4_003133, partial [Enterococcus faecium]